MKKYSSNIHKTALLRRKSAEKYTLMPAPFWAIRIFYLYAHSKAMARRQRFFNDRSMNSFAQLLLPLYNEYMCVRMPSSLFYPYPLAFGQKMCQDGVDTWSTRPAWPQERSTYEQRQDTLHAV